MPIKPENKARYPKDWKQIAASIRARAANKCEKPACRVPNYAIGYWCDDKFLIERGNLYWDLMEYAQSYKAAREACDKLNDCLDDDEPRRIVIVLTVAHLDHTPENCDPANLRAWCQRCHLRYDAQHHAETARNTRRARLATGDMFA